MCRCLSRVNLVPITLEDVKPGQQATTEIVVGTRDTAHHVGSGKIKVLATPVMVMLLEEAALKAVEGMLPDGLQSVGTGLDINHVAATPVGMRISAHAEVSSVVGRKIVFKVWADDESERIGEGEHERVVVELAKFDERVKLKSST